MTLLEVLAVWGIVLNERQAQQLLEEMMGADEPLLTREEAARDMIGFLNHHGGDVGQPWPTMEDALAWLAADNG